MPVPARWVMASEAVVPVPASVWIAIPLLALLPPPVMLAAIAVFFFLLAVLVGGRAESTWVSLRWRARPLTAAEQAAMAPTIAVLCQQGIGPAAVDVYRTDSWPGWRARGTGRRSVVMTGDLLRGVRSGRLSTGEAAALLAHACAAPLLGRTRWEGPLLLGLLPWAQGRLLLLTLWTVAAPFQGIFLLGWKIRFVYVIVGIIQAWPQARWLATLVFLIGVATYWHPAAVRAVTRLRQREGDTFTVQHQLGPHLVCVLNRASRSDALLERVHGIQTQIAATAGPAPVPRVDA